MNTQIYISVSLTVWQILFPILFIYICLAMPLPYLSNFHHPEMEQKKTIIFIFMAHSNRYNNCHSMTTSNLQRLILNQNEMTTKRMKEPKNQRRTNESKTKQKDIRNGIASFRAILCWPQHQSVGFFSVDRSLRYTTHLRQQSNYGWSCRSEAFIGD